MSDKADTIEDYLDALEPARRETVARARALVNEHLPEGFVEVMQYGMISWVIPLEHYAYTYNGEPLAVVSLASQKRHVALYLHGVYLDPDAEALLRDGFERADAKLDMGKSCLRFRRWEDVVPDAVGAALAAIPPSRFIELYEKAQGPKRMEKHRAAAEKRAAKAEKQR